MKLSPSRILLPFPVVALLALPAGPAAAEEFDEHLTVSGTSLRVVNLIGAIEVTGHDGTDFQVEVHVRGKDATRERVTLERKAGPTEAVVIHFPLDKETRYVYPQLGRGSSATFFWNPNGGDMHFGLKDLLGLGSNRKIKVTQDGDGLELWADVVVRVPKSGKLEILDGCGVVSARDVEGALELAARSGSIEANRVTGDLYADTGSGSVRVVKVTGRVVADTGSGSIHAEDVTGDLDADTGSGSVSAVRIRAERIMADTGSGSVALADITCRTLNVDTGSGGIEVVGASLESGAFDTGSGGVDLALTHLGAGPLHVDTGSGTVTVDLPPDPSASVEASTGSGGIQVDLEGVDWITSTRNEKSFRLGKGETRIVLETGSGGIRVRG